MKRNFKYILIAITALALLAGAVFAAFMINEYPSGESSAFSDSDMSKSSESPNISNASNESAPDLSKPDTNGENFKVYFVDVGQGDGILIETGGKFVIIDCGVNTSKEIFLNFLNSKAVKNIEYAIFTHPHADHIGCAAEIIENYKVKNVIMPNAVHTSKTYLDLISALEKHTEVNVIQARAGVKFSVGEADFEVLSPIAEKYENLNLYSVVLRADFKNTSFLFTGDAEKENEAEMIKAGANLKADVLKVGHHGSSSSSTKSFLSAVSPSYGIISCGADNSYGHPHGEVLNRFKKAGIRTYRTDLNGTVTAVSDGKNIEFSVCKGKK